MTTLHVNGNEYQIEFPPHETLGTVLNKRLGFTGVRISCEEGECGSCTVLMDGKPVTSCMVLAMQAEGKEILTIEGLGSNGDLHPIQKTFIDEHGFQCGFCTPGFILSAMVLLGENSNPDPKEIAEALSGHICRCGSYPKIIRSVQRAAEVIRREASNG